MVTTRRSAQRQESTEVPQVAGPSSISQRGRGRGATRGGGRGRSAARCAPISRETEQLQPDEDEAAHISIAEAVPSLELTAQGPATDRQIDGFARGQNLIVGFERAAQQSTDQLNGSKREYLQTAGKGSGSAGCGRDSSRSDSSGSDSKGNGSSKGEPREGSSGEERSDKETSEEESSGKQSKGEESIENDSNGEESRGEENRGDVGRRGDHKDSEGDVSDDDAIFGSDFMGRLASSLKVALQARAGIQKPSASAQPGCLPDQKLGVTSGPASIQWRTDLVRSEAFETDAIKHEASGAGAAKEKGLAQLLLAPPRVKSLEHAASSEGKRWFKLPATKITDEMKQELRLLRLRGAYDPKRFYKSFDETKFPKHFQIGTVLDNPQDFYSSRLTARERGASITQELLADPAVAAARKKRYTKLQLESSRYQKIKKRKTNLARTEPKPKRPKH